MDFDIFDNGWDVDQVRKEEPFHWISGANVFLGRYSPDTDTREQDISLRRLYIGRVASINPKLGTSLINNLGLNKKYPVCDIFRIDAKTIIAYLSVPHQPEEAVHKHYSVFVDLRLLDIHD